MIFSVKSRCPTWISHSIHLRPYGLRCLNWSSPYGLDQYALQALRPEVQKGQALRPGRWIKKNMQQVWNQDEVLVSHTIYLLFLWKRKSKTKRNQRISWAVRPKICFCPSGKTNEIMFQFRISLNEVKWNAANLHGRVKVNTFHWKITVRSQLLDSTPMHPARSPMHPKLNTNAPEVNHQCTRN